MKKLIGLVLAVMCVLSSSVLSAKGKADTAKEAMKEPLYGNIFTPAALVELGAKNAAEEVVKDDGWFGHDPLYDVRDALYFRFLGSRGWGIIFAAETGRFNEDRRGEAEEAGMDDPQLLAEIRGWRRVMMTSARDFLNVPANLWAVYHMAKPAVIQTVESRDGEGEKPSSSCWTRCTRC